MPRKAGRREKKDSSQDQIFEVDQILESRVGKNGKKEYYITWKDFGPEEHGWEPEENILGAIDMVRKFEAEKAKTASPAKGRGRSRSKSRARSSSRGRGRPKTVKPKSPAKSATKSRSQSRSRARSKTPSKKSYARPARSSERKKATTINTPKSTPKPATPALKAESVSLLSSESSTRLRTALRTPGTDAGQTPPRSSTRLTRGLVNGVENGSESNGMTLRPGTSYPTANISPIPIPTHKRNRTPALLSPRNITKFLILICVLVAVSTLVYHYQPAIVKQLKALYPTQKASGSRK